MSLTTKKRSFLHLLVPLASVVWLSACGDDDTAADASTHSDSGKAGASGHDDRDAGPSDAGAPRAQASRTFTIDETTLPFDALANSSIETDRWTGVIDGAGYRVEVPKTWNGFLVMYAHGYVGMGAALSVTTPSIRQHLIEQGYAWAASSYSTNYYDVRSGVEDTNKLALAFTRIASDNGRTLAKPTKMYLIGHSMGGHNTAAAIEKEALSTENNKVSYQGAVPMCGVVGDTQLFNYFAAYQHAAEKLSGVPTPVTDFASMSAAIQADLFTTFPTATTASGDQLKAIVRNLTGGARPMFDLGFASPIQSVVWGTFGGDGTIAGILTKSVVDTRDVVYQLDDDAAQSADETAFNKSVQRDTPDANANALRSDGLRWIPQVNGEISIPVVTLHTLGDMYVPFKMEQIYRQRTTAKGTADHLVQRVVRGTTHCEFTYQEQVDAFDAMINWEQKGTKPDGDEVLDAATVSDANYGCKFTNNNFTDIEKAATGGIVDARATAPACPTK
jgi:pimeloyl-ACP methyl ester carboxylesterase